MAELLLITKDHVEDTNYKDGDIIHAMNDLRIHNVHSQHICHKNLIGFNGDGLRPANSLTEMYLLKVKQYKFERISQTEIRRTNLTTLQQEVLSDKPNAKGEAIDVGLYIKRRLLHDKHLIFGTAGAEIWYGGRTLVSDAVLTDIWNEIESRTIYKKADHDLFPWGKEDQKDHLAITVDDFDNAERGELEASVYDDKQDPPVMTKRRKYRVDWKGLPGLTVQNITDIETVGLKVDIRTDYSFTRSQIVETKSLSPVE